MGKVFKALTKALPDMEEEAGQAVPDDVAGAESANEADEHAASEGLFARQSSLEERPQPQAKPRRAPTRRSRVTADQPQAKWDERLIIATGTASAISEQFRKLRTRILHPPAGSPARTILVTSAAPEEGKSFVCANLAIALAQGMEHHALLVDCDMRRPSLAPMFGLDNDHGLVDHLRYGTGLGELILKTGLQKLSILPSGPPPVNPAELLDSKRLATMIDEMASRYPDRFILFDSPPMDAAAETAVLAKHVDGVVLVVRAGYGQRMNVQQLVETVGRDKIVGLVFNAYEINVLESKLTKSYHSYYASYGGESAER